MGEWVRKREGIMDKAKRVSSANYENIQGTRSHDQRGTFSLVLALNTSKAVQQNRANPILFRDVGKKPTFYAVKAHL